MVGPLTCEGVSFPVSQGKAVRYMMDGTTLDKMYNLTEVKLTAATTNGTAVAVNGQKFDISTGVQIYLKQNQSGWVRSIMSPVWISSILAITVLPAGMINRNPPVAGCGLS